MKCSVCNTQIKDKYCSSCGQKFDSKKLSFKTVLSDIFSNLTDVEKSVFLNIYYIIRYPKKVINNYWDGFRGYYYKPGKMLFYFITIAGLSALFLKGRLFGLVFSSQGISEALTFAIVFFPLLNLSSFLTYRRYKRNYLEHLVSTIYLVSTFGIILLIVESVIAHFNLLNDYSPPWIIFLSSFVLIWNSILFTSQSKPLKIIINAILELIVLVAIITLFGFILYLSGAMQVPS